MANAGRMPALLDHAGRMPAPLERAKEMKVNAALGLCGVTHLTGARNLSASGLAWAWRAWAEALSVGGAGA